MKIYTKTGDSGETGLLGGVRVGKFVPVIDVLGDVDELNSFIGLVASLDDKNRMSDTLCEIQKVLFVAGGQIAAVFASSESKVQVKPADVDFVERQIDQRENRLPPLTSFILPGGGRCGAQLHVARSVCRRAERKLAGLISKQRETSELKLVLVFLNRLSDLLFVMARDVNHMEGATEMPWLPES